ncbi:MAG: UvrD-helicase domain-containing protein [Bacteroidetes bacterium]|nr:UvrD-helicase domain-containing protein [Bacteroidota bacterium]
MQNFVVYKSGAGSGKTFTLVKEYLRLALHDEKKLSYNYKRILAVTFTNKAAAEMKSRVIDALYKIAHDNELPFIGTTLCEELKVSESELKKRAQLLLSAILHHYSDFAIGTIDSFTHKIVKTFAHDLDLPVNFNIELDTQGFYEKVISELFSQIGEDEQVSKLLKEYALNKAEDNKSWDSEKDIQDFSKLLLKEHSEKYIEQLKQFNSQELEQFRKQFIDFVFSYRTVLKSEAQKAISLIKENNLTDDDFLYSGSGAQNFFKKCVNAVVTLEDTNGARLTKAVEENKWAGKNANSKLEEISPELTKIAQTLIHYIREHYSYYVLCSLLEKQMYPLMLLKKIEEISQEKKQEEKLVFISEFNQKIFDIIQNEPTPFIYERLGERYQHYLLDEFQDTSRLQWQNILPLLDNSLSNGWYNLIVGDGKQSIYRWRNANVNQFVSLPNIENAKDNPIMAQRNEALQRNFSEKFLNTNFRSTKTIVEFNNQLFETLKENLLSEENKRIYEKHAQETKSSEEGYITVTTGKSEDLDDFICNTIKSQIDKARKDKFSYKDVCILVRKNSHGNLIANYLVEQKIPVLSSDSLLLKNNLEINVLLSYLNYLVNTEDAISAASVLNYLWQSKQIGEDEFHNHLIDLHERKSLSDILKKHNIFLNTNELSLNNLLDNCIAIANALGLNKSGFHYIRFFLDEVSEFLALKNSNISSFFDWWESRGERASMIIPENTDAVKIMTIHASKGLEFPVVIVPYCNWKYFRENEDWVSIKNEKVKLPASVIKLSKNVSADAGFTAEFEEEQQEQILDNLNVLYVAFTRAVNRLHIISTKSAANNQKNIDAWIENSVSKLYAPTKENFYEVGKALPKQVFHDKHFSSFELEPLDFVTPNNVVRIKAAYPNSDETENARLQGIVMHQILSNIKSADDLESAVNSAISEGLVNVNEAQEIKTKLSQLIHHAELKNYFQPNVNCKLEAELITQNAEILRPDRIVFLENETVLMDYKTGKENNQKYFKQLFKYEQALNTIGHNPVKKILVYIDEMKVVEVK